jgi:folate-dependent phosphoribosylglycinamide formyltransferase PurN
MSRPRIVMVAGDSESTRIIYHALKPHFEISRVLIEDPYPQLKIIRNRCKRLGTVTVAGQLAFRAGAVPLLRSWAKSRSDAIRASHGLSTEKVPPGVRHAVKSVNSRTCVSLVNDADPDVVLVNGTRIISARMIEKIQAPMINTHAGITPQYRGVHGGYWALASGKREDCGVTVHRIDPGVDTGEVLAQALIEPTTEDCFVTYPLLQTAAAIPLLVDVIGKLARGTEIQFPPSGGPSKQWFHPTLQEYLFSWFLAGVR